MRSRRVLLAVTVLLALAAPAAAAPPAPDPPATAGNERSVTATGIVGSRVFRLSADINQETGAVRVCAALRDLALQRNERGCTKTGTVEISPDLSHANIAATIPTVIASGTGAIVCAATPASAGGRASPIPSGCYQSGSRLNSRMNVSGVFDAATTPTPQRSADVQTFGAFVFGGANAVLTRDGAGTASFRSAGICSRMKGSPVPRRCAKNSPTIPMIAAISHRASAGFWADADAVLPPQSPAVDSLLWSLQWWAGAAQGTGAHATFKNGRTSFDLAGFRFQTAFQEVTLICVRAGNGWYGEFGCDTGSIVEDPATQSVHVSALLDGMMLGGRPPGNDPGPPMSLSAILVDVRIEHLGSPEISRPDLDERYGDSTLTVDGAVALSRPGVATGTIRSLDFCSGAGGKNCLGATRKGATSTDAQALTFIVGDAMAHPSLL